MRRLVLLALVVIGCGSEREASPRPPPPAEHAQATAVLERMPYLGVSCYEPDSTDCDEVGLAVWLRHPAAGVEAEIDGQRFALDDREWSGEATRNGTRRMFAGFLQPAGLSGDGSLRIEGKVPWYGDPPVKAHVRLWIREEGGRTLTTAVELPLHPGWG